MEVELNKKTGKIIKAALIIALIVALIVLTASLLSNQNKPEEIKYSDLSTKILSGEISELAYIGSNNIRILYSNSKIELKNFPKQYDAVSYGVGRADLTALVKQVQGLQNTIAAIKGNSDMTAVAIKEELFAKDANGYVA